MGASATHHAEHDEACTEQRQRGRFRVRDYIAGQRHIGDEVGRVKSSNPLAPALSLTWISSMKNSESPNPSQCRYDSLMAPTDVPPVGSLPKPSIMDNSYVLSK